MTPCSATKSVAPRVRIALVRWRGPRRGARARAASVDGRHQQVVVADPVRVHLAVAAEHDDRDAAGLDLVHEPLGEVLGQRGERDHPVARDRRDAVVERVLVALVGERPDEPDLAAPCRGP